MESKTPWYEKSIGKYKYFKAVGFLHQSREEEIHAVAKKGMGQVSSQK